jgi:hypothetical protein
MTPGCDGDEKDPRKCAEAAIEALGAPTPTRITGGKSVMSVPGPFGLAGRDRSSVVGKGRVTPLRGHTGTSGSF